MTKMKTKKCKECGSQHHFTNEKNEIRDTCLKCNAIVSCLRSVGIALSRNGRRVEITKYKIEKVKHQK